MNVFEGIYRSFDDAKSKGLGFSSDTWINSSKVKLKKLLDGEESVLAYQNLLPFLLTVITPREKIKVLDFGGGIGITYVSSIKTRFNNKIPFEYHVVENERICKEGQKIFKKDKRIFFHSK